MMPVNWSTPNAPRFESVEAGAAVQIGGLEAARACPLDGSRALAGETSEPEPGDAADDRDQHAVVGRDGEADRGVRAVGRRDGARERDQQQVGDRDAHALALAPGGEREQVVAVDLARDGEVRDRRPGLADLARDQVAVAARGRAVGASEPLSAARRGAPAPRRSGRARRWRDRRRRRTRRGCRARARDGGRAA